jgi:putative NIF3 family GTP cyclohydrolase 1 type 2
MPTVHDLADFLAPVLDADHYHRAGDPAGVWIASDRPIRRLGLRLEPGLPPYGWAKGLDAVLIHRPFGLWPALVPAGRGVLGVHRALDERLSIGCNPVLADMLGLQVFDEPLCRDGRPVGLLGRLPAPEAGAVIVRRIEAELGGFEHAGPEPPPAVSVVAIVGAMTDELVRAAAAGGAGIYLTGQFRQPVREAVRTTGVHVLATGQARAEAWGLRHLGNLLRERWPFLEIVDSDLPPAG